MALWIHKNSCPKGSGAFVMWFHLHCPVKALVGSGVDWHIGRIWTATQLIA